MKVFADVTAAIYLQPRPSGASPANTNCRNVSYDAKYA
jgi:hypothetical protein